MDLGIRNKVAMVSGGSRGLGKQSAIALAREGCRVSICGRGKEDLSKALEEIRGLGYDVLGIEADVGTSDGCEHFYSRTVNELGTVDILVNNVGGTVGGRDFISATDQDWLATININLFSSVRLTRLVIPNMKENIWGRIVNIASIWGREYGGAPTYMTCLLYTSPSPRD